ncbi:NACHT domain-containing protein [Nostoc sp. CALU 1950]|uniref:NACHT domain-containing protein n=1 Tax=Nostoc sp. CALU 1950 TaxID=3104321 RepID=UPI003EB997BD
MSEPSHQQPDQSLNISGSVLESVQIGGIAGRDLNLTQIQGRVGTLNVFGTVQVAQIPISVAKPISQKEYRRRTVFLNRVKQDWIEGVLKGSLHTKILIDLGLEERKEFVQNLLSGVEEFPVDSRKVFSEGTAATDIFEGIGAGRTLLILGEPGAGKTVTLLKLTESLIARTENNLSQPLPVVVNLSSWAQQRKSITNWLVQELFEKYHVPKPLGKAWVEQEQLILLLDGLDEVDAKYRNDCVKALNQFIQEHGLTEMVVCSRIQDYKRLSERLKLRSAIYVQPLTSQQIDQFLERAGEQLSALKTVLQHNAELRAFASSPLILSIMSLSYQGCSLDNIIQGRTIQEYRQRLFDTYINRMFEGARLASYTKKISESAQKYPREKAQYWLIWMAQRMAQGSETIFLIEELQPSFLSQRQRFVYRIESGLIASLIGGLICWPSGGLTNGYLAFWWINTTLVIAFVVGLSDNIKTVETLKWSWREATIIFRQITVILLIKTPIFSLIIAVIFSLIFWFVIGLCMVFVYVLDGRWRSSNVIDGLIGGLIGGLLVGLLTGLIVRLMFWLISRLSGNFRRKETQKNYISYQAIWKIVKIASVIGIFFGIVGGIHDGLIVGLSTQGAIYAMLGLLIIGPLFGLLFGLFFALIIGPLILLLAGPIYALIGGFRGSEIQQKNIPNQGIWKSARNALTIGMIIMLVFVASRLFLEFTSGVSDEWLMSLLNSGLSGGMICGGSACLRHFILRLRLYRQGNAPWNYARFLDYTVDRLFMQKVGGGYIFVHRMLLEHFAQMNLESK